MTTLPYRQLPLSRLGHLIPPLVEGQALVALVPSTADLPWAAKAAWDIARIAARREGAGARRIALVDLWIEEPALHQTVGLPPGDGIVDAFEYGVSLNKAAREVDGVFFIGAGSYTAHTRDLYGHARWPKLQAGFRSEGALLLLFISAAGLARLSAVADGAIVLAPDGLDAASAAGAEVTAALERGVPLLGVARDRWMPSAGHRPTPAPLPMPAASVADHAVPRRRGLVRAAAATIVVAAAVAAGWGGWALFAGGRETLTPAAPPAPDSSTPPRGRDSTPAPAAAAAPTDTIPWTIQLAAYGSMETALKHADQLASDAKVAGLVTPVQQNGRRTVWYRVLAGSYGTRAAAAAARDTLWRHGVAPRGIGDLVRAPYSFVPQAGQSLAALRRHGVPAVRWPGTDRLLVGAFQSRDQAAFTEAALTRAGVRATLLPRVGTTP